MGRPIGTGSRPSARARYTHAATNLLRPADALVVLAGDAAAVLPALEAANLGEVEVIRLAGDGADEDDAA